MELTKQYTCATYLDTEPPRPAFSRSDCLAFRERIEKIQSVAWEFFWEKQRFNLKTHTRIYPCKPNQQYLLLSDPIYVSQNKPDQTIYPLGFWFNQLSLCRKLRRWRTTCVLFRPLFHFVYELCSDCSRYTTYYNVLNFKHVLCIH